MLFAQKHQRTWKLLEWLMAALSIQLKLESFLYFCHHYRDSRKTVSVCTQPYWLLLLNFWKGEGSGLVCKFCSCSFTLSRSVRENIGLVKFFFCYSDFSESNSDNVETSVFQPCEVLAFSKGLKWRLSWWWQLRGMKCQWWGSALCVHSSFIYLLTEMSVIPSLFCEENLCIGFRDILSLIL